MKKLAQLLKDRSGETYLLTVAIALGLFMVFAGISEYFRLLIIAQGVRDGVQSAVISTVTTNYANTYHGAREGYAGGYQPVADSFEEALDYGDIYGRLDNILGLTRSGDDHVKLTEDGYQEFKVYNLRVNIKNAPLASNSEVQQLEAECSIRLEVPISFAGEMLPPMKITVRLNAGYRAKF